MPASFLGYLSFLEIVFAPFDQYSPLEDPAFHDWKQTIESVKGLLNLPRLTLRVYIADYEWVTEVTKFRLGMTEEQGRALKMANETILIPLRAWGGPQGLRRFLAYIPSPWGWKLRRRKPRPSVIPERLPTVLSEYPTGVEAVERMVMGPDYDSMAMGKDDVKWSEWLEATWLIFGHGAEVRMR